MAADSSKTLVEFPIAPIDARLVWLLPGIAVAGTVVGIIRLMQQEPRAWMMLPAVVAILALMARVLSRRRISLNDGTLAITAGVTSRRVAIGDIDLATARIIDLRERNEWKPSLKLMGTRIPGLSMGHFRLRDRSRAFVLLTDTSRVLLLNERSGRRLLLSLAQPQALLDALRAKSNP